ncbi:MAG: heme-copper oxidase subunit III [Phycisphaerales bacterium]
MSASNHHAIVGEAPSGHGETMPSAVGLPNVKLCMWLFLVSEVMFFAGLIGAYVVLRFGTRGWPNPYDVLAVRVTAANTFLLICTSVTMVKAFQWSDYGNHRRALGYLAATIVGGAAFVGVQIYEYGHLFTPPSEHLLHHVEELMHDEGLEVPGHGHADSEHARATGHEVVRIASGETLSERAQTLNRAYEVLAEGRPEVKGSGTGLRRAQQAAAEWDERVIYEAVLPLLVEYPDDSAIKKAGVHHNQYPEGFIPGRDVFTSTFYIMTGFHGAHVAGGVVMLAVIFFFYLFGRRSTMALEVAGLYWHFVDLVWIILFTIVYLM